MDVVRRRGRAWRYPDRKRCFACRSYFGFAVLDGLYCSEKCARIPEISADPADWPREHYSLIPHSNRVRRAKRDWVYPDVALAEARRWGKQAYRCSYCLGLHIGTPDPNKVYPDDRMTYR